ncbi:MAG TPA: DUF4268 domain-containing protein [Actinomycetes bacterium]|jgi:hypothetical protein|nr:DUF4268 domain-containing protein [Actinomycetes bacterium]
MEMERLGLGRLERLDLRSFWGEQLPDLTPWFVQNVDLLGQTLGIDITPMQREVHVDNGAFNVLGTDALGRPIVIENRLEEADPNQLGQLITHASTLESAVVVWVSPRFDQESRRTLEWLNDRTDSKVDFFGVELGLVRIGRSLPAPVLDVVVQPRNWRKSGRRQGPLGSVPSSPSPPPPPPPPPTPSPVQSPLPQREASHIPPVPPPLASEKDGGLQPAEVRHGFFQAMFESVARRKPGFRVPKFGYENWVGFAAGPFGFYDVAFTANGAVRAGVYLDMQERTATKRLFDDLFSERMAIETAVGRILSWERLDDRRASRVVDYREVRDLANSEEQRLAAEWAAETVVALMDALDARLRSTAQTLLSRVQGGV